MPHLRFSQDARSDLKEIARYIARDKPVAARQWVEKIKSKCRLLTSQPDLGESRPDLGENVRFTLVGSYVVFYRRSGSIIEVSRVIRGDREIRGL
jgi:toxin ParE1/3/4